MLGHSITFNLSFFRQGTGHLGSVFGVILVLESCPVAQFPKGEDHPLRQYVGIHGFLSEL